MSMDIAMLGIGVDASGVKSANDELDKLTRKGGEAEESTNRLARSTDLLTRLYKDLAGAFAAWKVFDMIRDATMLAARYDTLGVSLRVVGNNAQYTGAQLDYATQALRQTGISMLEARQQAISMTQAQIDLAYSTKLARIAQDAAVIGNINSSEAFARLIHGIQSGQTEILRGIGLNVSMEQSYKALALTLHKQVDNLSQAEKTQAVLNSVMKEGEKIAGTYEAAMGTAGKQINSMKRYVEDLKVTMGEVFQESLTVTVMGLTEGFKGLNYEAQELAKQDQLKQWGRDMAGALLAVANQVNNIIAGVRMGATLLAHLSAQSDIRAKYAAQLANVRDDGSFTALAQRKALNDAMVAELKREQDLYEQAQTENASRVDSIERAAADRQKALADQAQADAAKQKAIQDQRTAGLMAYTSALEAKTIKETDYLKAVDAILAPQFDTSGADAQRWAMQTKVDISAMQANAAARLALIKERNSSELKELDMLHEQQLVSDNAYYLKKMQLELSDAEAERAKAQADIAAVNKNKDMQPDQRIAKLIELQGQLNVLKEKERGIALDYTNNVLKKQLGLEAKTEADALQRRYEAIEAMQKEAEEIENNNKKTRDGIAEMNITADALVALKLARIDETIAIKQRQLALAESMDANSQETESLRRLIAAMQDAKAVTMEEAQAKRATDAIKEQAGVWKSIEQTAHDTFISIFDSGKSAFTRLRDTLKNTLYDLLYQMTLKKWLIQIVAGVSGGATAQTAFGTQATAGGGFGVDGSTVTLGKYGAQAVGDYFSPGYGTGMGLTSTQAASASSAYMEAAKAAEAAGDAAAAAEYTQVANNLSGGSSFASGAMGAVGGGLAAYSFGQKYGAAGGMAAGAGSVALGGAVGGAMSGAGIAAGAYAALAAIPVWGWIAIALLAIFGAMSGSGGAPKMNISTNFLASAAGLKQIDQFTTNGGEAVNSSIYTDQMQGMLAKYAPNASYNTYLGGIVNSKGSSSNQGWAFVMNQNAAPGATDYDTKGLNVPGVVYNTRMENGQGVGDIQDWMAKQVPKLQLAIFTDALRQAGGDVKDIANSVMGTATDLTAVLDGMDPAGVQAALKSITDLMAALDKMKLINSSTTGAALVNLVKLSGGLDNLGQMAGFFAQNFLTDAERMAPTIQAVHEQMAALGYGSVTTNDQFKALVMGLNLADAASQELYVKLLALAPQFKSVADYQASLTATTAGPDAAALAEIAKQRRALEIQIMEAQGNAAGALAAKRADELAAMDATLRPLQQQVYALEDQAAAAAKANKLLEDATSAVDAAMSRVRTAVESERDAITKAYQDASKRAQDSINGVNGAIGKLQSLSSGLHSTLDRLRIAGSEAQQRSEAQAQIVAALAIAKAGGMITDASGLQSALQVAAQPSENLFATFEDYQRDFYGTAINISDLAELTDGQLTTEQQMLAALQNQQSQLDADQAAQMSRLDGILGTAQAQVDAIHGVDNSVLSVTQAIVALQGAIVAAKSAQAAVDVAKAGGSTSAITAATSIAKTTSAVAAYGAQYGGDAYYFLPGSNDYSAKLKVAAGYAERNGTSVDAAFQTITGHSQAYWQEAQRQYDAGMHPTTTSIRGFANGGYHAGGWRIVGERGPELAYTGPQSIISNPVTRQMVDNSAVVAAIEDMGEDLFLALYQVARNTGDTSRQLSRWDVDGLPATVED